MESTKAENTKMEPTKGMMMCFGIHVDCVSPIIVRLLDW